MSSAPSITISSDKSLLDVFVIHNFLTSTYWAKGRTLAEVEATIRNTDCYGIYLDGKQIGFTRVLTDRAVFAYLMDVFILEEHRGNGYAKMLLTEILNDPKLEKVRKWLLKTSDAHDLYKLMGFKALDTPERFMEMTR